MKLSKYLEGFEYDGVTICCSEEELTIYDDVWDMESYVYKDWFRKDSTGYVEQDAYSEGMRIFCQKVDISKIRRGHAVLKIWDLIQNSVTSLIKAGVYDASTFDYEGEKFNPEDKDHLENATEIMMSDIMSILAGGLSEEMTKRWAEALFL